ncbi:acyltransferase [Microbacterium sp. SORGH_AS_0421]|uniref:acyltransferase family protein n=1 Tax=Microbacterium sp. SORGH_AS_0421 TaxID=3041768 RepID=UPI00278E29FD|nr:acyltransferase [Microbacterium sp. SORGH_AS_0421]MDQ1177114.1 peptidoglycan/LPS O-acetylase OafA/YrhL [Microbacterium sp. SORGH_AS_0421]
MTTLAAAFDPRRNSIGFLRWFLAFAVIFSHAGPIAGFYGGKDLGTQWSDEQSLGGVAVCGFFFLSGFLITRSKMGRSTTPRFFWHRILRIYPGWFLALLTTAFVLAPIAWYREKGTWDGFWNATSDSPLTYFVNNFTLILHQLNIAGMGKSIPQYAHGISDWNGSAWTLAFEFGAYLLVGALGVFGALANRLVGTLVASGIIALAMLQWLGLGLGNLPTALPILSDFRALLLLAPFAWGIIFCLWMDRIPIDDRMAVACLAIAFATYAKGGWLVLGQYAFAYFIMWFAVRVPITRWDRYGDFSYGIYIIGWPLMVFATYFGLQKHGLVIYHVVVIIGVHLYAVLSWHLIEKPAMSLKNWTPRWYVRWREGRGADRIRRAVSRLRAHAVITERPAR